MSTYNYLSNDVNRNQVSQKTLTASVSVPGGDASIDHNIATDALVISLPKINSGNLGMTFLFRNSGADGNNIITLSPHSTDGFNGSIANASADSVASVMLSLCSAFAACDRHGTAVARTAGTGRHRHRA